MTLERRNEEGDAPLRIVRCSFCGKAKQDVKRLFSGPGGVFICNECVTLCQRSLEEVPVHPS